VDIQDAVSVDVVDGGEADGETPYIKEEFVRTIA
jgi:hypothetical protein